MSTDAPSADAHEHRYVHLRQEKRNVGAPNAPRYEYTDVFFCERCLDYRRVVVTRTTPSRTDLGKEDEVYGAW